MFRNARIKLTTWYLVIIMLISVSFSLAIYEILASELSRIGRVQRLRMEHSFPNGLYMSPQGIFPTQGALRVELPQRFFLDQDLVNEVKNRLKIILVMVNIGIFGGSAAAGYFLAGRTLKPISQMIEEQNRFISDSSHELRTPLTSLKSEIEVNLRDKNLTLNDARNLLKSNLEEVNNLQILSDNLIKLIQYQKNQGFIKFSELNILTVSKEAAKKVAALAKAKNIFIENNVHANSLAGDNNLLVELLVILLDNAIKYSPENTTVTLESEKNDGKILISVSDKGIGIEEREIPYLFDRFYRSDKSRTKTGVNGYGLGLSIAKQIVDKHKGSIRVQSKINEGSTFIIQIPVNLPQKNNQNLS